MFRVVVPLPPSKNATHEPTAFFKKEDLFAAVEAWRAGHVDGFKMTRRAIRPGRRYSPEYEGWLKSLDAMLEGQRFELVAEGDIKVTVTAFFKDRRIDMPNIIDPLLDGLQTRLFRNDSQVAELVTRREIDKDDPRCVVTVEPLNLDLFSAAETDVAEDAPLDEVF